MEICANSIFVVFKDTGRALNNRVSSLDSYLCFLKHIAIKKRNMKIDLRILFYLLIFILSTLSMQAQKIDQSFQSKLVDSDPNHKWEAYILLNDHVDIAKLGQDLQSSRASLHEKGVVVVQSLKQKAESTQNAFIKKLTTQFPNIQQKDIDRYWIANIISVYAPGKTILDIAKMSEVAVVFPPIELVPTGKKTENTSMVPNGKEPGIVAINTEKMWAMGYTGYGRTAYVFDSGEDFDHPSIRQQFAGNHRPFSHAWSAGHYEPFDVFGHGTHVTGTICGLNRLTRDTIGVAYNGTWIGGAVQFIRADVPRQPFPVQNFLQTMQYALDPDGNSNTTSDMPDVINNSWSGQFDCSGSMPFSLVVRAIDVAGIASVWSAGNDGPEASTLGGYQNINYDILAGFAVGATITRPPFTIADFSSRGPSRCGATGSLAIKPEVSAPGVTVRSAVNGGGFAFYNGTSMASPHVSGAILLLKEAFPDLDGRKFLEALYFSAVDLGEIGEDNIYGNGIIDVFAAYNYLLEQGYTPTPPIPVENNVLVLDVKRINQIYCKGPSDFQMSFYNDQIDTLRSLKISYWTSENDTKISFVWEGALPRWQSTTISISDIVFNSAGVQDFYVEISEPNGLIEARTLDNLWRLAVEVLDESYLETKVFDQPEIVCGGARLVLFTERDLEEGERQVWIQGNNVIGEGQYLTTSPLEQSTEFEIDRAFVARLGLTERTAESVVSNQRNAGLVFDAHADIVIKSMKVYADGAGNRVFDFIDGAGQALGSKIINLAAGENIVNLDFFVPRGTDLKILYNFGRGLQMEPNQIGYPYAVQGLMTIKSSTGFSGDANSIYPYFYDIQVERPFICGPAILNVMVDDSRQADPHEIFEDINDESFIFYTEPTEGNSYTWYLNGEEAGTGVEFSPNLEPGLYHIILKSTNAQGCSSYAYRIKFIDVVNSSVDVSETAEIIVSPNPSAGIFQFSIPDGVEISNMSIIDIQGRRIAPSRLWQTDRTVHFDLGSNPSGAYLLKLDFPNTTKTYKLIKQ